MAILIAFLTLILVLNSLLLTLLVLIQLPKKEAGAGVAFGGGATDALFGAGSGNALTQLTKYCAGIFLGLCLLLSILNGMQHKKSSRGIQELLEKKAATSAVLPPAGNPALPSNSLLLPPTAATSGPTMSPTKQTQKQDIPPAVAPATNPAAAPKPR